MKPVVVAVLAAQAELEVEILTPPRRRFQRRGKRRPVCLVRHREQGVARGVEFAVGVADEFEGPRRGPEARRGEIGPVEDAFAGAGDGEPEALEHQRLAFARLPQVRDVQETSDHAAVGAVGVETGHAVRAHPAVFAVGPAQAEFGDETRAAGMGRRIGREGGRCILCMQQRGPGAAKARAGLKPGDVPERFVDIDEMQVFDGQEQRYAGGFGDDAFDVVEAVGRHGRRSPRERCVQRGVEAGRSAEVHWRRTAEPALSRASCGSCPR